MDIGMLSPGFPPDPGGVPKVAGDLARQLSMRGERVMVLTHGRVPSDERPLNGLTVRRFRPYLGRFAFSPALAACLRRTAVSVWHAHAVHSSLPALAWLEGARPYVLTPHFHGKGHTPLAKLAHVPYAPLLQKVVAGAAAVVAVSESEAALLSQRFNVPVSVIPNGVDLGRLAKITRTDRKREFIGVLVVARLVPYKRVDLCVHALKHLPPHFRLIVQGQGPQRAELVQLAKTLGLEHRVELREEYVADEDLWQLISDADVLVNLSEAEAFSVAVLEALALGTPVVVSDKMALAEWARKFPADVQAVATDDPKTIAAVVQSVAGTRVAPDLRRYDLAALVEQLVDIYDRVI